MAPAPKFRRITGRHIHPVLVIFPIALFPAILVCDLAFCLTRNELWATMSFWLLATGWITGVLAGLAGLIDFIDNEYLRLLPSAWRHVEGNAFLLLIQLINFCLRSAYGSEDILYTGLILSMASVLIMVFTIRMGLQIKPRKLSE